MATVLRVGNNIKTEDKPTSIDIDMILNYIYIKILYKSDFYGVMLINFLSINIACIIKKKNQPRIFIWSLPDIQIKGMSNPTQPFFSH